MWYLPLQDTDMLVLVLPTGRADYFGTVSNLAARVAGLAAPGQILVEGREAFRREKDWRRQNDAIVLLPDPMGGAKGMPGGNTAIELEQIGYYLLKVGRHISEMNPRYVLHVLRPMQSIQGRFQDVIACAGRGISAQHVAGKGADAMSSRWIDRRVRAVCRAWRTRS